MSETTRRAVLAGAAGAGAAAVLAACGSGSSTDQGAGSGATTGAADPNGGVQARKSDIPVGGGTVFDAQQVVVTQPSAGTFKAFSAVCTHQGCIVADVKNGVITCPCHGSQYSASDGSVTMGPATKPLSAKTVTVNGDSISVA